MNGFLYKIQSLPEHRRYIIMQATFVCSALMVFSLVAVVIGARIQSGNGMKLTPAPIDESEKAEYALSATPAKSFFNSFGSLKTMFISENLVEREKHGFSQLGLIGGEYLTYAKQSIKRVTSYILERWLTKTVD